MEDLDGVSIEFGHGVLGRAEARFRPEGRVDKLACPFDGSSEGTVELDEEEESIAFFREDRLALEIFFEGPAGVDGATPTGSEGEFFEAFVEVS